MKIQQMRLVLQLFQVCRLLLRSQLLGLLFGSKCWDFYRLYHSLRRVRMFRKTERPLFPHPVFIAVDSRKPTFLHPFKSLLPGP